MTPGQQRTLAATKARVAKEKAQRIALENAQNARQPCKPGRAHHWMLGEPQGRESVGKCRYCKGVRVFRNASPEMGVSEWFGAERRRDE